MVIFEVKQGSRKFAEDRPSARSFENPSWITLGNLRGPLIEILADPMVLIGLYVSLRVSFKSYVRNANERERERVLRR